MIPSLWIKIEELPLTANGKLNKKALPTPDFTAATAEKFVAPIGEVEQALAVVWQEVLMLDQVGRKDNFFELGGDSIISIQIVSRVRQLGYQLKPGDLFEYQSLMDLAQRVATTGVDEKAEQELLSGTLGLTPIQHWFFESDYANPNHFNQAVLLQIDKDVSSDLLAKAFRKITAHHDALRMQFKRQGDTWSAEYGDTLGELEEVDLRSNNGDWSEQLSAKCRQYQAQLDVEKGPLVRMVRFYTPASQTADRLFVLAHHLGIDGVSWRILLADMERCLSAPENELGPKGSSYRQWQQALSHYATRPSTEAQLPFWQEMIKGYQALPVDISPASPFEMAHVIAYEEKLNTEWTDHLLKSCHRAYRTGLPDLLLTALAQTFCRWLDKEEIVIGLEGHGREAIDESIDLGRTVGWFTSLYPVALKRGRSDRSDSWIKSIKESLRKIKDKGLAYGVLRYLHPDAALRQHLNKPAWDIEFNYLGQTDNVLQPKGFLKPAAEPTGSTSDPANSRSVRLVINAWIKEGQLEMAWHYSTANYLAATITSLAKAFMANLRTLIADCMALSQTQATPSDFQLSHLLSPWELDAFLDAKPNRRNSIQALYPLSPIQEGLLFHSLMAEGEETYINQFSCELQGLDIAAFKQSWANLQEQYTILRTAFYANDFDQALQAVYQSVDLPIHLEDYSERSEQEKKDRIATFLQQDRERGFDLEQAPLFRVQLFQLSEDRYQMIWTHHHIINDGWSTPLIFNQLLTHYEQKRLGQTPTPQAEDHYEDYIRYIESQDQTAAQDYWKQHLHALSGPCLLPFVAHHPGRNKGGTSMACELVSLSNQHHEALRAYAHRHHLTINTILQGIWAYILSIYTSRKEVVFGVTVSGRPADLAGAEHRVGPYINTIPFLVEIDHTAPISEWLSNIQSIHTESRQYQYSTLNDIQGWNGIVGDFFDSLMVYENYPMEESLSDVGDLKIGSIRVEENTNYLLTITIKPGATFQIELHYNAELLAVQYVKRLAGHLNRVLEEVVTEKSAHLSELSLLTKAELAQLQSFQGPKSYYPQRESIVSILGSQAMQHKDKIAVRCREVQWTYEQLDHRSNQMGHYLRSKGIRPEQVVSVCLDRSVELLLSLWSLLKSGGVYLPLDPGYPPQRINQLLRESGSGYLLTSQSIVSKQEEALKKEVEILLIEEVLAALDNYPTSSITEEIPGDQLAYVIYTSGSTGRPKGAMIEHRGMLNHLYAKITDLGLNEESRVLQNATQTFDISIWQLLVGQLVGGETVIYPQEVVLDSARFVSNWLADELS
ncbi:MAG: condensation domain-containing protein, partial [Bacteroidota bacterium]